MMTNLRGIGSDAVKAQQHDEGGETWVTLPGYFRLRRHNIREALFSDSAGVNQNHIRCIIFYTS